MVINLSIVVHALPIHVLTLLTVGEILLPRYMKRSTNFYDLLFNEEMAPSRLKHIKDIFVHNTYIVYCSSSPKIRDIFHIIYLIIKKK